MSEVDPNNPDPFLSQKAIADNSYILEGNGMCQACGKSILGKAECPYCGAPI